MIRASQALSRQVHLPDLLRALAATVMENAGAERAVLLLERDGHYPPAAALSAELTAIAAVARA